MKYLIKIFMGIGFATMLFGMGAMDSPSMLVPICLMFLGLGMFAFGGYLESYYEWYSQKDNR